MRMRARIILLVSTWLLTACGVKSAPKPPKPKPATTTSELKAVPREGAAKKVSGTFSTTIEFGRADVPGVGEDG